MAAIGVEKILSVRHWNDTLFSFTATRDPALRFENGHFVMMGLQVDGYAGYNRLIAVDRVGPNIQLAYCWAHARRKLIEITRTGPAPIAEEGVALIRDLYAIEADIRGSDPAIRLAVRQDRSAPILARIDDWLTHHRARASAKDFIAV